MTMTTSRALAASAVFCAVFALAAVQPVFAAGAANPQTEGQDSAATETSGTPSGTLEVASEEMRLIMGGTAGKGTLHFKGKNYAFTYKSASAGIGAKMVKEMSATGEVFHLTRIEDFEGQYAAVSKAALAGESEVEATYKNDKGVVVTLRGTVKGAGLSLGGGIATIKLVK
jgi:hypothetical protein